MKEQLIAELRLVIKNIDYTIDEIKRVYSEPYRVQDRDGRFIMVDILAAKANALAALANLENS